MKNRQNASRAQLRQRQSFVATAKASIAKRRRRRAIGYALDLPRDKQSLRDLATQAAASHPIRRG